MNKYYLYLFTSRSSKKPSPSSFDQDTFNQHSLTRDLKGFDDVVLDVVAQLIQKCEKLGLLEVSKGGHVLWVLIQQYPPVLNETIGDIITVPACQTVRRLGRYDLTNGNYSKVASLLDQIS